jgi:hypothetical protein
MKQKITNEQIERMKRLKADGESIANISRLMNLHYVKVAYYVGDYKQKIEECNKLNRKKHRDELNELNKQKKAV